MIKSMNQNKNIDVTCSQVRSVLVEFKFKGKLHQIYKSESVYSSNENVKKYYKGSCVALEGQTASGDVTWVSVDWIWSRAASPGCFHN